jgi:hypothetical protein
MKVQAELDETKIILHKTIESVLERGEKLDNLVERSDQLSAQSRLFYKTAKKQVSLPPFRTRSLTFRILVVLSCRTIAWEGCITMKESFVFHFTCFMIESLLR